MAHRITRHYPFPRRALSLRHSRHPTGASCSKRAGTTQQERDRLINDLNDEVRDLQAQNRELRQAQDKLLRSHDHYANLYEYAPIAYFVLDSQGLILQANLCAAAMLGVNRDALASVPLADYLKRQSRDAFQRHREAVFANNSRQRCRLEIERHGMGRLCVQLESVAFGPDQARRCRTVVVDTTYYERMEEVLQSLTERLEQRVAERTKDLQKERDFSDAIINKLPGIVLILDREAHLLRSNIGVETAADPANAGLKGHGALMDLIPPEEHKPLQAWIAASLLSQPAKLPQETTLRHRDGSQHLYNFTSTVLKDTANEIDYLICFGMDITDQRKAQAEASHYLDEAARLQRLQTASELATAMGHELNQPLGAISMYADASRQLLEQPSPDRRKLMENLKNISEQGLRGGEIIRQLRRFINRNEIDCVPLDLNTVVHKACELMAPKATACGVTLKLLNCPTLPPVNGVAIHLEQVLLNLLRNAIEAIQDAGMPDESVTVVVQRLQHMARVTVRDSGPGIDPETARQMLKFLHSTKDYGLGVGLCISFSLIKAHGGRLWIEPQQPGGVIHFELPLVP
ncbi:MAG: ATP-binding protein [Xanthomonadales bacterium]|nr:ATP-binding protein [Xanthomonadales bacterium]